MPFDTEFQFFQNLIKNMDLPIFILPTTDEESIQNNLAIYYLLNPDYSYSNMMKEIQSFCHSNCVYCITDKLLCSYLLFELPKQEKATYVLIGPFSYTHISKKESLKIANKFSFPTSLYSQLEKFYRNLAYVADETTFLAIINTFGTTIWGSLDNFTVEALQLSNDIVSSSPFELLTPDYDDSIVTMHYLEETYQIEHNFLKAVKQGQTHKAEMYMKDYAIHRIEPRLADPIRNIKNYSFILNTLLRKAVEEGGVHPIHIDRLSTTFAKKIESITTDESALALQKEMVHKYCLLVKNHSLQNYSPLIKKIITYIDTDLTADLSLKAHAQLLNINASYLSSLFKKEMGMPLTEYVNRKRIDYAISLLNTTNLQIQIIAQYCGIPDVNYFTKTFKKFIGETPQSYRRHISSPISEKRNPNL